MATKFLKSQNGGIYKDSTGKPIAVEPERVIRDIEGNIPASTLEDISVSTGTASNGVTYIHAQMKGEVTYTDNTTDTIQYNIDLPIKAGDGVTIEAQPLDGGTGNKQLVISASGGGGGGTTLNKYSVTADYNLVTGRTLISRILQNAKSVSGREGYYNGPITFSVTNAGYVRWTALGMSSSGTKYQYFVEWDAAGNFGAPLKYNKFTVTNADTGEVTVTEITYTTSPRAYMYITYYNDTEIT